MRCENHSLYCDNKTLANDNKAMGKYNYSSMGATAVEVYNNTFRKDIISGIRRIRAARLSNLVTCTVSNNQTRKLQDVSYTFKIDNSISSTLNTPDIDTNGGYLSTVKYNYKHDGLNRFVKAAGLYTKCSEWSC